MNPQIRLAEQSMKAWVFRHMHTLIGVFGTAFLLGTLIVFAIDSFGCQAHAGCDTLGSLGRSVHAADFEDVVWQSTGPVASAAPASAANAPTSAIVSIRPLRWMMFVDSLGIVPGYAGLLITFMVALYRLGASDPLPTTTKPRWWKVADWPLQLACFLAVSAAIFDIAENGMTVRAAEDALERLLADPTVADVHLATTLKWSFIALASAALGAIVLRARYADLTSARAIRVLMLSGVLACGLTTLLLISGQFTALEKLTRLGALSFALELALIGTGLWKLSNSDDVAPLRVGKPAYH